MCRLGTFSGSQRWAEGTMAQDRVRLVAEREVCNKGYIMAS